MNVKSRYLLAATMVLGLTGCGGGTFSSSENLSNLKKVSSPVVNASSSNKSQSQQFVTVTVCQNGTDNCQTIDHIQVDHGSTGLRVNKSALALKDLTPVTFMDGAIYQCVQYASGYNFGPVVSADIKISGETANDIPIQIINDNPQAHVPSLCSQGFPRNDLSQLGKVNGVIGIDSNNKPDNSYTYVYSCDAHSSDCKQIYAPTVILTKLNINPMMEFPVGNNEELFN